MSLVKVADFAGLSRAHLARLLAAQQSVTIDTLAKLAAVFEVPARELLP